MKPSSIRYVSEVSSRNACRRLQNTCVAFSGTAPTDCGPRNAGEHSTGWASTRSVQIGRVDARILSDRQGKSPLLWIGRANARCIQICTAEVRSPRSKMLALATFQSARLKPAAFGSARQLHCDPTLRTVALPDSDRRRAESSGCSPAHRAGSAQIALNLRKARHEPNAGCR